MDSTILQKDLYFGHLSANRHGNGQDWWIVAPAIRDSAYYKILLNKEGIQTIQKQDIGPMPTDWENGTGRAVFSPNGTKYARYSIDSDIQIMDFDRCTGEFSNYLQIPIQDFSDTAYACGVEFSPSGQFLYAISTNHIYQFDMYATDIAASKTTVAVYDHIP